MPDGVVEPPGNGAAVQGAPHAVRHGRHFGQAPLQAACAIVQCVNLSAIAQAGPHRVVRGGRAIQLQQREFKLLEYLMRHALAETINLTLRQIELLIDGIRNTANAVAPDRRTPLAELRARRCDLVWWRPFVRGAIMPPIELTVNGNSVSVAASGETPLLDVLRNHLGLVGTKFGCGLEQCGCCMVLIDGRPERSCGKEVGSVAGRDIVTIEGLGTPARPHPLQQAFLDEQAGQCGYCLAGILISAKALLDRNPSPSRGEIAAALDDNLCRCGSHNRILRAVERAAVAMRRGVAA